jgi:hypothetical protein
VTAKTKASIVGHHESIIHQTMVTTCVKRERPGVEGEPSFLFDVVVAGSGMMRGEGS